MIDSRVGMDGWICQHNQSRDRRYEKSETITSTRSTFQHMPSSVSLAQPRRPPPLKRPVVRAPSIHDNSFLTAARGNLPLLLTDRRKNVLLVFIFAFVLARPTLAFPGYNRLAPRRRHRQIGVTIACSYHAGPGARARAARFVLRFRRRTGTRARCGLRLGWGRCGTGGVGDEAR